MHTRSDCASGSPRSRRKFQSHNQQIETLSQGLEGLKRAVELFDSEQSAIVELLRTSTSVGDGLFSSAAIASAATAQNAGAHRKRTPPQRAVRAGDSERPRQD